jgi:hypothetical protein
MPNLILAQPMLGPNFRHCWKDITVARNTTRTDPDFKIRFINSIFFDSGDIFTDPIQESESEEKIVEKICLWA